jgi:hypothetical protein
MMIGWFVMITSSRYLGNIDKKDPQNGYSHNNHIKPKDICVDATTGAPKTDLSDGGTCSQTYVNLYKKLPSATVLTTDLEAYTAACPATQCAKPACNTLVSATSITYNDAFKTSFKANCIPAGASTLLIDACTKGDDTKVTGLEDASDCIKSYEDLVKLLPDTDPARRDKFNMSFLEGEAAAFTSFATKCLKSICSKDECYAAIVKTPPSLYNAALKKSLTEKCDPNPTGEGGNGDSGLFSLTINNALLLFAIVITNFNFWL